MWVAVRQRFAALYKELLLTDAQAQDGLTKTFGIRQTLQREYYGSSTANPPGFLVGSWGKITQVRPTQDVDLMFELPADVYHRFTQRSGNVQSALLQEVKDVLLKTYSTSSMRGDGQVVQLNFNTVTVEVVPVFALQNGQYYLADANDGGRWKIVDPRAELTQIDSLDQACNGNVRALCRMLKLWKREQNVPLKSFQIELLVQEFMASYTHRHHDFYWYDWFVRDFFRFLLSKVSGFVRVPGTGEIVPLGDTWQFKVERAAQTAAAACQWEYHDYDVTAGQEWQKIFGSRSPIKVI